MLLTHLGNMIATGRREALAGLTEGTAKGMDLKRVGVVESTGDEVPMLGKTIRRANHVYEIEA